MASLGVLLSSLLLPPAAVADECDDPPCLDAEPLWLPAGESAFSTVASGAIVPPGRFVLALTGTFRRKPVVLRAPSPAAEGREVRALDWALDGAMALSFGMGSGFELDLVTPVGLSRSGAGIKGVTAQSAPPLANVAVTDPRIGVAYALFDGASSLATAKAHLELKLPFGDASALSSDGSPVAQGGVAVSLGPGDGLFAGADLSLRLRAVSEFFGARIGSAVVAAGGVGYVLASPGLRCSLEAYVQPSLVASGPSGYVPAEGFAAFAWAPRESSIDVLAAFGAGLPFSRTSEANTSNSHVSAVGVPAFRALVQVRYLQR